MDIGDIVSDAIRYPTSDWKKVIILGILFIISFLIIPVFLVMGYFFRVLKASIAGSDELPEFDEWGEMFVDGLKVFVVQLVYFIIPAIIIIAGTWASIASMMAIQGASGMVAPTAAFGLMGGAFIVGLLLMLVIGLIATIAIANMAYYDSEIGAAFRFSEILDKIAKIGWVDYIIWYIVMIIIVVVFGFIAGILNVIPILGFIISLLVVYPFMYMFFARSLAWIYLSGE